MLAEMNFRSWYDNQPAIYHEAGHIAVAMSFDEDVFVITQLGEKGNGIAGISTYGFSEEQLYCIGVAGYLAEARGVSTLKLEVAGASGTIANVITGRASKEPGFKIEVPLAGGQQIQAACSRDDFGWLKRKFNEKTAKKAAEIVADKLNGDAFWARVEDIAGQIARTKQFRNGW